MSKRHTRQVRKENICQNCGHNVAERYCSQCGQENVEGRQSFRDLALHFMEDLTHYDGKFWITLKYLFFRPAYLTKLYLSGKRSSFLPPVRLYVFASFITFLLPHLLPDAPDENEFHKNPATRPVIDTNIDNRFDFYWNPQKGLFLEAPFKTMHQLDSARDARLNTKRELSYYYYTVFKRCIQLQRYTPGELWEKFMESLTHNFPKALFLFMPLFALVIKLFHSKKKWLYFDHSIFTIHYFSFVLLTFSLYLLLTNLGAWIYWGIGHSDLFLYIRNFLFIGLAVWYMFYFFRAHKVMYGESLIISIAKSVAIYSLNVFFFLILFVALVILTIWMLQ